MLFNLPTRRATISKGLGNLVKKEKKVHFTKLEVG
jgi:hypothetical protein